MIDRSRRRKAGKDTIDAARYIEGHVFPHDSRCRRAAEMRRHSADKENIA